MLQTKEASTDIPLSPEEEYEASRLFGRGLFSAIQLAKERELRNKAEEASLDSGDVLRIPIPMSMMPHQNKMASHMDTYDEPGMFARALQTQSRPLKMLTGGQAGFGDAKKDYYMQEKARINQELERAQQEYIDLLSQVKTGAENSTPCIDAFCNGVVSSLLLDKEAAYGDDMDLNEGALGRLTGDAFNVVKKPFQPATDTVAGGLLSSAAMAAELTRVLRKKMRENPEQYMEEKLPTRVELQPY